MVGKLVYFSIQEQQQDMRLISSWQTGTSKGLQPAMPCSNLNLVYFWPLQSKF
jgi:hypothetical protein